MRGSGREKNRGEGDEIKKSRVEKEEGGGGGGKKKMGTRAER